MWKKNINLTEARALSYEFCKNFDISYCEIYFVDTLNNSYGQYIYLSPPHALILDKPVVINKIGIVMHELTHHLEYQDYLPNYKDSVIHGYYYQLAKNRTVTWCRKNISKKPNWFIPLKGYQREKDMIDFIL